MIKVFKPSSHFDDEKYDTQTSHFVADVITCTKKGVGGKDFSFPRQKRA